MTKVELSFIIPAKNEERSVEILHREISDIMKQIKKDYEIIFIDDGSTDDTFAKIKEISAKDIKVRAFRFRGNFGKSVALQVGFDNARGDIIFTLDADLQDNPKEIPHFLQKLNEGYDLVSGWKKTRHDPTLGKVIPSRIINYLTRKLTGIKIHDTNCGFKAYKKNLVRNLNLYGELYRFIPILAAKQNFKVGEVVVEHRSRKFGKTKFGWSRGLKGILDLLTVIFLTGYIRRPGHFFGGLGLLSFFLGFLIGLYISYLRLTTGTIQDRQPLLFLGILLMVIGIQFISTGLLAEMMVSVKGKIDYNSYIKEQI
ncbi:MAG: Undecaprenyl-phosphate 4-deoxy-4-formamido-L-arabinose transferase [Berkelbacteria bacterium GW2011_GWA1_36_9]|uniref:Undecaprenyl-phosphate 4-deoxy-4-formamido-L-arabinose transferase n=1 Tax=Berkelbacteria bacterium GW2011_GWA1_36_9 TaxID=1618331 RepID=A0A0G0FX97_9BACT|nr:MAG: Undecaprenyl-phosphate 4-deoxy-4-formamido-L-arabinose transferase [Berkelbacteria bacterium GW2011_GWA1_36_9]